MKQEDKISIIKTAAQFCGLSLTISEMDLLISMYELVFNKQKETTIGDIENIMNHVNERTRLRQRDIIQRSMDEEKNNSKL